MVIASCSENDAHLIILKKSDALYLERISAELEWKS